MTFFGMALITAAATAVLAVFAVFTARYARKAFREQSQEVHDQAKMLKVQSEQLDEQRKINAEQTAVLRLQAQELEESLAERKREREQRSRAQASRVFVWQEHGPVLSTTAASAARGAAGGRTEDRSPREHKRAAHLRRHDQLEPRRRANRPVLPDAANARCRGEGNRDRAAEGGPRTARTRRIFPRRSRSALADYARRRTRQTVADPTSQVVRQRVPGIDAADRPEPRARDLLHGRSQTRARHQRSSLNRVCDL